MKTYVGVVTTPMVVLSLGPCWCCHQHEPHHPAEVDVITSIGLGDVGDNTNMGVSLGRQAGDNTNLGW